ncbi:MAG: hypothetical protein WA766_09830, partial [Candidatus Acidiferrales bacterium]
LCTLPNSTPAWLLSGTPTSGSWMIEATFEPPFRYRDEGLLLNTAHDLSTGLLVSMGPFGKLTLLRIKGGEVASVAMEFPLASALGPRALRVTRVGASYDFWVDGIFVGNIANPLQERTAPPRWTDETEPDAGEYGVAFQEQPTGVVRNLTVHPLSLERKYVHNPVLKPLDVAWEEKGIFTGSILKEGGTYFLYYSGTHESPPAKDQPPEGITRAGVATSKDLRNWERGPNNPILLEGKPGDWDRALQVGCVVRSPDKRYALLFDGFNGKRWGGVGVAYSNSPLGPFEKYSGNPVLTTGSPGQFDGEHVHLHTCLQLDDGRYALLYTGFGLARDPIKERAGDQGGLAFSSDLIHWEKYVGNPVLSFAPIGTFYDAHLRPKGILKRGEWYYLFFEGAHNDKLWFDQASLARSKDLVHWEKFPFPLPSLGTGQDYDSIVTEWPVPTVSPDGNIVLLYMCLPLGGYSLMPNDPNKLSICMTQLPNSTLDHWDDYATPLTRDRTPPISRLSSGLRTDESYSRF